MSGNIKSESEAAHLFREECGHLVRYVPEWDAWIIKDGKTWEKDTSLRIDSLIRDLLDSREDIDPKWKGSLNIVRNVKGFAKRDQALHVSAGEIDAEPLLVGTKTGVYRLDRQPTPITPKTRRAEGAITASATLRDSYNRFLQSRNLPEVDASYFGRQLTARGYQRQLAKAHKGAARTRCFVGIRLRLNT